MENREQVQPKKKEKIVFVECECKCVFNKNHMKKHRLTIKHIMLMRGATINEYHKFIGDKASVINNHNTMHIPFRDAHLQCVRDVINKYQLDDPWLYNLPFYF